jgi:3-hydroxyisobutyrate dehydrogenase-like beta-hydroxyacid dehydrogenase
LPGRGKTIVTSQDNILVGMVGLGHMGGALAESLLTAGFRITVWNRTATKADRLRALGAEVSSEIEEAAQKSDVMVVCLLDHAATRNSIMTSEVGKALKGKTLVQLSTTTKDQVDELVEWTDSYGIQLLKGGILVYPDDIRAGRGAILYGGSGELYATLQPMLMAMGGMPIHICEKPADAVASTSASYSFLYSALLSYLFGAAICHRTGISVQTFTDKVIEPFVSSGSLMQYLSNAGKAAANRQYQGELQATLDVWDDALQQTIKDLEAIDIDTAILRPLKTLLEDTSASGYGESDIAAVVETLLGRRE